jgi:hypothetical protein
MEVLGEKEDTEKKLMSIRMPKIKAGNGVVGAICEINGEYTLPAAKK